MNTCFYKVADTRYSVHRKGFYLHSHQKFGDFSGRLGFISIDHRALGSAKTSFLRKDKKLNTKRISVNPRFTQKPNNPYYLTQCNHSKEMSHNILLHSCWIQTGKCIEYLATTSVLLPTASILVNFRKWLICHCTCRNCFDMFCICLHDDQ